MAVNAEKLVMDWLNADTTIRAEYPAMFDVPAESSATHPIPFVTVEQVGGSDEPFRSLPLIAVQVWGESRWLVSEAAAKLHTPPPQTYRRTARGRRYRHHRAHAFPHARRAAPLPNHSPVDYQIRRLERL